MRNRRLFPHLTGSCLLIAVVLTSHFAAAALPSKATLISPSGIDGTNTPAYYWHADPNSTWYYLWVNDSTGNGISQWVTAAQAGCYEGTGRCSVRPDFALAKGSAKWWIQTWNPSGDGPWSDVMVFTVPDSDPPGKAALISPSGTIDTPTPTYTWNADPNSTWYYLWVNDSTGNGITLWFTAAQAACYKGTGSCSVTPDIALAPGSAKWWIQTWSPNGKGPWSDGMVFTVTVWTSDPPGKAALTSPSGTIGTNTPNYTWNENPNATSYYLWVNDSTGTRLKKWYSEDEAGCVFGTICSVTPDIALAPGAAQWWIQTWNSGGCGPWSDGMVFTVPTPVPPGKATLASPSGAIGTNTPNYTWQADPYSTSYYLWVNDSTGIRYQKWYTASQAGCPGGTGTCTASPGVYLRQGLAKWWIQTWSPNGTGPWSDGMAFTVPAPVPGSTVDLGNLGGSSSEATKVSADGSVVVGRAVNNAKNQRAFRWKEVGGMVDLGTLGGRYSYVNGLSMDGSVIVGASYTNAGLERAFRWKEVGGMVDLGTLGGSNSVATGVSMDGRAVVGYSSNGVGNANAFRWTEAGGMVDLGSLGGSWSSPTGLSTDGSVVVGDSENNAGNNHAFRWTHAGGMVDLGTLGGSWSSATGLSTDGSVVVGRSAKNNSAEGVRAFRWTQAGGMVDLGTLGGSWSEAIGVSMDGSVVAGVSTNSAGNGRAFRWTEAGGMVDLGSLGGSWSSPTGLSTDGSVVVGSSENKAGSNHAFRWTQAGGMVDLGTLGGKSSMARGVSADGNVVCGHALDNFENNHAFRWK